MLTPGHPGRDALVSALDALLEGGAVPMIAAGRADIKETAELAALAGAYGASPVLARR